MSEQPFTGVTPVGGPSNAKLPKGPVIVFTEAHLRCPCRPNALTQIESFENHRSIRCGHCMKIYALPAVTYRWPPGS